MELLNSGIYEEIINKKLKSKLESLDGELFSIEKEALDVEEARKLLSSYISSITRKALKYVRDNVTDDKDALFRQIQTCNEIITVLSDRLDEEEFRTLKIDEQGEILTSIQSRLNTLKNMKNVRIIRPVTPISQSSLFTGASLEPNMLSEMKKEILSSDRIDMLVSFIKWSGLRCILEELKAFTDLGGELRVITTSYMEATDYKAIIELSRLENTQIKISYDVDRTRLHAKAYLFKRDTGFSTAYIGSSNLSNPALTSGLEWNIKVTEKDSFDILEKFKATFESYWNSDEFYLFDAESEEDRKQLKIALKKKTYQEQNDISFTFDIRPYHYQKEMLEKLQVEREVFGRYKNLLVAATGVGKTVISAFDYKRFMENNNGRARLLFVAHREEILKQSRDTFRAILKDFNFGDMLVGGYAPDQLENLFVSIQSFNSKKLYENTTPDFYDFIIVDEFHHAAADSYQKLLNHYKPKVLLGLTATPERMDGQDILKYFEGTIATEMRLTEAINQKLLSPFQYFCISDTVDLSKFKWSRKGYDIRELENVYTSNKIRSNQIVTSIKKYVTDLDEVKGLGFCVSIEHAIYMANYFNQVGIPSIALYGKTDSETRKHAQHQLVSGEIKFIFVVDLYNEGIDIPEVNTILFLRPTESLTVFVQQLGRGLRLSEWKECLTVLDFVGQAHKNYNFEEKFRALVGRTKHSIRHYLENGFFNLPKGSFIQLEKQAKEYVLRNIKESGNTRANLVNKMKYFSEDTGLKLTLENFLNHYHLSLYDFYGKNGDRTFSGLRADTGLGWDFYCPDEKMIAKRLPNLFFLNSRKLLEFLIQYIEYGTCDTKEDQLMVGLFYYSFYNAHPEKEGLSSIVEGLEKILCYPEIREEILSILRYNYMNLDQMEIENGFDFSCPLGVHSRYSTSQVMAALDYYNYEKSPAFREGVKYFDDKKLDIFFITLNKSEKDFSPSTQYEDYAINEKLFHWQTQSRTKESSPTAQRYIHHRHTGNKIALFVREYKSENGYTAPFTFLGTANYVSHSGNSPISFIWELEHAMPPALVPKANKSIL
jgi:superfamily II DNA or RNA helicase